MPKPRQAKLAVLRYVNQFNMEFVKCTESSLWDFVCTEHVTHLGIHEVSHGGLANQLFTQLSPVALATTLPANASETTEGLTAAGNVFNGPAAPGVAIDVHQPGVGH